MDKFSIFAHSSQDLEDQEWLIATEYPFNMLALLYGLGH
jgi:hypothetical protein